MTGPNARPDPRPDNSPGGNSAGMQDNAPGDQQSPFGIIPRQTLLSQSGRELLAAIVSGKLPQPPICQTLGFRLTEVGEGAVVFEGRPNASVLNPMGGVHGGYAATLLDSCMACAAHSLLPAGEIYTTLELKVNLVRAIAPDMAIVRAVGDVVHRGRRVITAEGRLIGGDGKLYAHGTTTCLVMDASGG